jgi:undecaprenyl-phosphate galactose phosphotransferase/putative colanic acid biosynthesis UDP-glucose lipid carrier transferase
MSSVQRIEGRGFEGLSAFRLPFRALAAIAASIDGLVFVLSGILARALNFGSASLDGADFGLGVVAALFYLLLGRSWGLFKVQTLLTPERNLARIVAAALFGVLSVVCLLFLLKTGSDHSRGAMALFAVTASALTSAERLLFSPLARWLVASDFVRGRRVVLIGDSAELDRLNASEALHFGFDEVARFGLSRGRNAEPLSSGDRSRVEQAIATARRLRASEIALFMPWSRNRALAEIVDGLRGSPLPVRLYPDHSTREVLRRKRESHFDPYLSVEVQREPLSRMEQCMKRGFDVATAGTALLGLSPLLILTAVLIKLDSPGPVIFRQVRRGFDNREFRILKFRTMTVLEDGPGLRQARRDDERVTRIGRILRRTSVDELPQLVNVLRGDMSIVGPRPHAVAHDEFYEARINEYALRRHVKPGLTGAAQVNGLRGETRELKAMEARVQRDLWYINNWSLWLDIKLVAQTFVTLCLHEAY